MADDTRPDAGGQGNTGHRAAVRPPQRPDEVAAAGAHPAPGSARSGAQGAVARTTVERSCCEWSSRGQHDRFLRLEDDIEIAAELVDMAVTWHEMIPGP